MACFDKISHEYLLQNVPMDTVILRKFLKAGFMENGKTYPTELGTPQGGVISPTLAVMALSGLESSVRSHNRHQRYREKINVISYADDFVVTAANEDLLRNQVIPAIKRKLSTVGLELSEKKTRVTKIDDGFDFLGFNIRKYANGKLLIKPSKANISDFLRKIKKTVRDGIALPTDKLIYRLNQLITGWTNYYRSVVASKVFANIDSEIFDALKRWCLKRHSNKGLSWIRRKYYTRLAGDNWRFFCITKDKSGKQKPLYLKHAAETHIRRHKKIKGEANPFNPQFKEYFKQRYKERKAIKLFNDVKSAGLRITQPYAGLSAVR